MRARSPGAPPVTTPLEPQASERLSTKRADIQRVNEPVSQMGWRGDPPPFYPSADHNARDRCVLSAVTERLYLTNFKGAEDVDGLKKIGCTHVAAVGEEFLDNSANDAQTLGIKFWNCAISDDEHQGSAMADSLRSAAAFINGALGAKGCVVVHCAAGISRSATVVLGYFLIHRKMTLRDSFSQLIGARGCIWPNDAFMAALIALEAEVRGANTITLAEYERWGDYEGPLVDDDAAALPMGPPRLVRDDTFLDGENEELERLEEESEECMQRRQRRAALEEMAGRLGISPEALEAAGQSDSSVSVGGGADAQAVTLATPASQPSSPASTSRRPPKRMSLSKQERRELAEQAREEASYSRRGESSASARTTARTNASVVSVASTAGGSVCISTEPSLDASQPGGSRVGSLTGVAEGRPLQRREGSIRLGQLTRAPSYMIRESLGLGTAIVKGLNSAVTTTLRTLAPATRSAQVHAEETSPSSASAVARPTGGSSKRKAAPPKKKK